MRSVPPWIISQGDEALAVRRFNERERRSATRDVWGRYAKKLVINGRNNAAVAQAITDLFWNGCTPGTHLDLGNLRPEPNPGMRHQIGNQGAPAKGAGGSIHK
jgi:hypothetical protein